MTVFRIHLLHVEPRRVVLQTNKQIDVGENVTG